MKSMIRLAGVGARFVCLVFAIGLCTTVFAQDNWIVAVQRNDTAALTRMLADQRVKGQVDARASDGKTALMAAAAGGAPQLLKRLIDAGADPATANFKGAPALIYAAWKGNPKVLQTLIAQRVSLEHAASNGWTALTMASAKGNVDAIRVLLKARAKIDPPDVYGWTPLMRAVNLGRLNVVQVLVKEGNASLTRINASRQTALHLAAAAGHNAIYSYLIDAGADPDVRDGRGQTPREIAQRTIHN